MSDYTEEQITTWQNGTIMFIEAMNEYIRKRNRLDPKFNCEELDLEDPDEDISFDIYGDHITIQWKEHDRCGDVDYFNTSFPLSHLWSLDWDQAQQQWEEERKKEQEAKEAKKAEAAARQVKILEARERAQLEHLRAKYAGATA